MSPARRLGAGLSQDDGHQLAQVWYRAVGYEVLQGGPPDGPGEPDPLWDRGAALRGARYTPQGKWGFPCLYLGDAVDFAVRESAGLTDVGVPIVCPPSVVVSVQVDLRCVLDLTDENVLRVLGVPFDDLVARDWALSAATAAGVLARLPITQRLGRMLEGRRYFDGVLVPSSMGEGRRNLVVFTRRLKGTAGSVAIVNPSTRFRRERLP